MVKIQKISEIEPRLGFTEFDMLKKYRQSFATSELGRLHSLFPFSECVAIRVRVAATEQGYRFVG